MADELDSGGGPAAREHPLRARRDHERPWARPGWPTGDVYVDDAFGAAHRAHASTEGAARLIPDHAAGLLLERRCRHDRAARETFPALVAVLGGAKVTDKLGVIESFRKVADQILIGGAMCFPFLASPGHAVGDRCSAARTWSWPAGDRRRRRGARATLALPRRPRRRRPLRRRRGVPDDSMASTCPAASMGSTSAPAPPRPTRSITTASTVFWNGPMGAFESSRSAPARGRSLEAVGGRPGVTVVGGGDSAAALASSGWPTRSRICRPAAAPRSS